MAAPRYYVTDGTATYWLESHEGSPVIAYRGEDTEVGQLDAGAEASRAEHAALLSAFHHLKEATDARRLAGAIDPPQDDRRGLACTPEQAEEGNLLAGWSNPPEDEEGSPSTFEALAAYAPEATAAWIGQPSRAAAARKARARRAERKGLR